MIQRWTGSITCVQIHWKFRLELLLEVQQLLAAEKKRAKSTTSIHKPAWLTWEMEQAYKNLNLLAVKYGSWKEDAVLFFLVLVNSCSRKQAYNATVIQNLLLERCVQEDYIQRHPTSTERQQEWGTQLLLVPLKNFTFNSTSEKSEVSEDFKTHALKMQNTYYYIGVFSQQVITT